MSTFKTALLYSALAAASAAVALGATLAVAAGPAQAETVAADPLSPEQAAASLFNGVWAPERHGPPGGPGGPGRGPGFGPPGGGFGPPPGAFPGGAAPDGANFNLGGGGDLRGPPRGRGPGFGPPGGGFGPPPGFGPPGGPGGVQLSAEDAAKGLDQGDVRTRSQMTDAGKAEFARFDPLLTPTANCKTPGLPSIAMIPELQEWKISGDAVTIHHESDSVLRTVHLDQTTHPTEAHTVLGHAYGALIGDTLTIETANLNAEWGGLGRNAPGSDARIVRETYRLIDKDTIQGEIEVQDSKFLTHSLRMPVTLKRQPVGSEIVDFPCDVEVAQRDYKYMKNQPN